VAAAVQQDRSHPTAVTRALYNPHTRLVISADENR
jgi:hypothetical protein